MFQIYINNTLHNFLNVCCVIYLNNIFIYLSFKKQYKTDILTVLECLWQTQLFIKLSKYEFETIKVFFLSYVIEFKSVKMKFNQIKIIEKWFLSCNIKKIQFFLKFVNFYCRFIESYFKIAVFLHELIKSTKKKEWRLFFMLINIVKNAFDVLKAKFISALLLIHFNFNK